MALGSFLAGRLRILAPRPLRAYGLLEIEIGLYGLLFPLLIAGCAPLYRVLCQSIETSFFSLSLLRFVVSALLLLLAVIQGSPGKAEELSRRGIERSPQFTPLYLVRGMAAISLGCFGEAEETLKYVLSHPPAHPEGHFQFARLEARRGDKEAARKYLGMAMNHGGIIMRQRPPPIRC